MASASTSVGSLIAANRYRLGGGLAAVLALVMTIVAAIAAGQTDASGAPTANATSLSVVFVVISAFFQVAGAFLFSRDNSPNLKVFKNALRRQGSLWGDLADLRGRAEIARELATLTEMRSKVGELSVGLSAVERDAERVIADWASVLPDGENYSSKSENLGTK